MQSPRPPPRAAYGAVLILGALLAPLLLSLDGTLPSLASYYGRRSLGGVMYSLRDARPFAYFQPMEDVDTSIEERAKANDDPDRCARVFLYLPDIFAEHGHGSQINTYIMAATTATYMDRALVLLEPPLDQSKFPGGSQFGCPVETFLETVTRTTLRVRASYAINGEFPGGFSRLFDHPAWLSRGCEIPCAETQRYGDWLLKTRTQAAKSGNAEEFVCQNPDGSESNVVVLAGSGMRNYFRSHEQSMVRDRQSPTAEKWVSNLGASPQEAQAFSHIVGTTKLWDHILGFMNRAGFLKLQPWIARDVALFLKSFDLPLDSPYEAIHVRRGDKLDFEALGPVQKYWRMQGHTDMQNLPTNYVPFAHYLEQWDGPETCATNEEGKPQVMKHNVYVATDDPVVVREEIAALPDHVGENTVILNGCHELRFFFNPTDDDAFHLNGKSEEGFAPGEETEVGDTCFGRYHRNIVSIADMMILSKARTFIGEYNSNWGRVIRQARVRLNTSMAGGDLGAVERATLGVDSFTYTLDTRVAFGSTRARAPGY